MSDTFTHDTWLYHKDGPRLFAAGEDLPGHGWKDTPAGFDYAPDSAAPEPVQGEGGEGVEAHAADARIPLRAALKAAKVKFFSGAPLEKLQEIADEHGVTV